MSDIYNKMIINILKCLKDIGDVTILLNKSRMFMSVQICRLKFKILFL